MTKDLLPSFIVAQLKRKYGTVQAAARALGFDELPQNGIEGGPRLAGKDADFEAAMNDPQTVRGAIKQLFGQLQQADKLECLQELSDMHGAGEESMAGDMRMGDRLVVARAQRKLDAMIKRAAGKRGRAGDAALIASPERVSGW
jgi:hypothetical protein